MGDSSLLCSKQRHPYFLRAENDKSESPHPSEALGNGDFSVKSVEKRDTGVWVVMEGQEQGWCMLASCI